MSFLTLLILGVSTILSVVKVTGDRSFVVMMAADSGLVRTDEEIIAIAGTGRAGRGADTALVMQTNNAHRVFDIKVKEIICKPRL